jgi:hypothetical protein
MWGIEGDCARISAMPHSRRHPMRLLRARGGVTDWRSYVNQAALRSYFACYRWTLAGGNEREFIYVTALDERKREGTNEGVRVGTFSSSFVTQC